MKQITVRLSEELIGELDRIAENSDRSRAEVIRDELNSLEKPSEVERLRTEVERLRREKRLILEHREENTELVNAVKEERSLAKRKAEAGLWTKTKWALFGMDSKEDD